MSRKKLIFFDSNLTILHMAIVVKPEEGFHTWLEKKADVYQLATAKNQGEHILHPFKWAYLLHVDFDQFDGHQPEDHFFYSNFRHGDEYVDRSDEKVAELLNKFGKNYNIHIENLNVNWDAIFPLLDQMIEKYWGQFGAMFIQPSTKTIFFTCSGVELATAMTKTAVALFGTTKNDAIEDLDGKIHVEGPVFYSGGRIFWHSFMRTMGFSTIKGPKYQIFEEIERLVQEKNFYGVSNLVDMLNRFWNKKTYFALYNGQAKLDV